LPTTGAPNIDGIFILPMIFFYFGGTFIAVMGDATAMRPLDKLYFGHFFNMCTFIKRTATAQAMMTTTIKDGL